MSKEAMIKALEALEAGEYYIDDLEAIVYATDDLGTHEDRAKMQAAITVLRLEIDALNMASKVVKPDFWEGYVPEPDKRQQALDKKAENARALGLDYEPAQQEPVAWTATRLWNRRELWTCPADIERDLADGDTSPPAQRTWVGLTDEEAFQICVDCGCLSEDWLTLLDAIEAKLKEKNNG